MTAHAHPRLPLAASPTSRRRNRLCRALVAGAALLALSACGDSVASKTPTQVAARVDAEEISVHQVNFMLAKAGQVPPDRADELRTRVLDRLVEQSLLYQKARDAKLERNPDVLQALEAARREILARAYLEQAVVASAKPGAEDIRRYYAAHPALFAERKIYRLRELAVSGDAATLDRVRQQAAQTASLEALGSWLQAQQIAFRPDAGVKAAEQLPLEQLPTLHRLPVGQHLVVNGPGALVIVEVAGTQTQPMDEKTATPLIEQFLLSERRTQLAEAEVARLKGAANIEYLGEFAAIASAKAEPAAPPAAAAAGSPLDTLNKGLKGLK